jgi:hypothetical protein
MNRSIEAVGGAVAAIVALVVAVAASSLGAYWWALALIGASGLAAGVGAYLHLAHGRPEGVTLLLFAAGALIVMTVLAIFSVGIFLLPAAVAASAGAVAGRRGLAEG